MSKVIIFRWSIFRCNVELQAALFNGQPYIAPVPGDAGYFPGSLPVPTSLPRALNADGALPLSGVIACVLGGRLQKEIDMTCLKMVVNACLVARVES